MSDDHRKPDCIIASKCEVWEFKPDSPAGKRDGAKQRASYNKIVPAYYTERHRQNQPADAKLGGAAIMSKLKEKCLVGDSIVLSSELHRYDMCKEQYECLSTD